MAAADFLPVCDLLFNLISLTCYFCDVVFVSMVTYTLYDYTGGHGAGIIVIRVVTVPVSVPFSVPVQNCRNFSVFRF